MKLLAPWLTIALLAGCSASYPTQSIVLNSGNSASLLSVNVPNPTAAQKAEPVVITAHGYGATTFETSEVANYLSQNGVLVSQVLLGAHGTNIQDFANSNWKIWQAPMLTEYNTLVAKGYSDISVLGTSTGGTLWLEALSRGVLNPPPKRIVLVDALVDFDNHEAGYAGILPWFGIDYRDTNPQGASIGNWYRYDPASTIVSLVDVAEIVKEDLKNGIQLPSSSKVLAIQATGDPTVDPVSVDLIDQGLHGAPVTVDKVDSDMHIPIWPDGVDGHAFTQQENDLRNQLLQQIQQFVIS